MTPSNKKENPKKEKLLPEHRFLIITALAILLAFIFSVFVIRITHIDGDSMEPTLSDGDWMFSLPLAYTFDEPKRGDVVLIERKSLTSGYIIKRVVGLPGETVAIREGIIYINGKAIDDNYYYPDANDNLEPMTIGEDCFFVLGDNRSESNDSRYWSEPTVGKKELRGKAVLYSD